MKRDDILLDWVQRNTAADVSWVDIGAGDGAVSRAISKIRSAGAYSCWDTRPRHHDVKRMRQWSFPPEHVDLTLFNFVLHHLGGEGQIDRYIAKAFRHSRCIVIQEDIDDGTKETRAQLRSHDAAGLFLSLEGWKAKLGRLCGGARLEVFEHHEPAEDTFGYDVPRALFVVHRFQGV